MEGPEPGRPAAESAEPRDFGRDGVSGLVDHDRAMRARDVSRPSAEQVVDAEQAVARLLARTNGRR